MASDGTTGGLSGHEGSGDVLDLFGEGDAPSVPYESPPAVRRGRGRMPSVHAGEVHGRWTLLTEPKDGKCLARCTCGTETVVQRGNLTSGKSRSCGCLKQEVHLLPEGEAMRRNLLHEYKNTARRKGHTWALTGEEASLMFKMNCHYCGAPPSRIHAKAKHNSIGVYVFNGLDRVDSSQGYEVGNVVPCCSTCNRAKLDLEAGAFLAHVARIQAHPTPYVHRDTPPELQHPYAKHPHHSVELRARKGNRVFELTREETLAMFLGSCVYCGLSGTNRVGRFRHNGIDRVDSSVGYTPSNSVPCCKHCNRMKMEMSVAEFLAWASRVRTFQQLSISTR